MANDAAGGEARQRRPRRETQARAAARAYVLANPDLVLDDPEVAKAIIERVGSRMAPNVVNLQAAVLEQMRRRMRAMEIEREEMIDAAEMNMVSMTQIHDAVLNMLEAPTFSEFIEIVSDRFRELLAVDSVRLGIETELDHGGAATSRVETLLALRPGDVDRFFNGAPWGVTLRPVDVETARLHASAEVTSEAIVRLDFGPGARPGAILFGAEDPDRFHEEQGGELLVFLGGAVSRAMRRWIDGADIG